MVVVSNPAKVLHWEIREIWVLHYHFGQAKGKTCVLLCLSLDWMDAVFHFSKLTQVLFGSTGFD